MGERGERRERRGERREKGGREQQYRNIRIHINYTCVCYTGKGGEVGIVGFVYTTVSVCLQSVNEPTVHR